MKYYLLVFSIVYMFSFSDTSLKKRISDENYRYEFYTTDKKVAPRSDRNYYWFKGGRIHQSEEGVAGELLHDEFLKFYHSNSDNHLQVYLKMNGLQQSYQLNS